MRKSSFEARTAEKKFRTAFLTPEVRNNLKVSKEEIEEVITEERIQELQAYRLRQLEPAKEFKVGLETRFPTFRFSARIKSVASALGKELCHRSLADIYGIKVIVPAEDTKYCYWFKAWLDSPDEGLEIVEVDDRIRCPKPNGYRDLKVVVNCSINGEIVKIEFIIQTPQMYIDSHTIQKHQKVYPWKYHENIRNLPAEYGYIEF